MPIEYDDLGLRIIGHNVKGLKFYDDDRVLRAEIYLQDDDTLNIGGGIGGGGGITIIEGGCGAPVDAQYVVLHAHDGLSNERVLTAGPGVGLADGGANGALTVSIETACSFFAPALEIHTEDQDTSYSLEKFTPFGYPCYEDIWTFTLGAFVVPANYGSGLTVEALVYVEATGNLYSKNFADYGACGEPYNEHSASSGYTAIAMNGSGWNCIQSLSLADAQPGDIVALRFQAERGEAADTVDDTVYMPGWRWSYQKKRP